MRQLRNGIRRTRRIFFRQSENCKVTEENPIERRVDPGFMPVSYENEADLLDKLQPGIDGIIIRSGDRQALLLPSEWKDYEDKQAFLNSLKLKAGLNPGYWSNKIKVYRFYTVEIEKK